MAKQKACQQHRKRETESLSAAQEEALNTNPARKIYHKNISNKCKLCGTMWRMFCT